jgi:hypothetical protein
VDALAFTGAALGSGAVQLPFAGMGNDPGNIILDT